MCEPATLIGLLGAGVSAMGAIQQGNAQADAANYQAAVDRNNAILSQRSARDSLDRAAAEEQAQRRKTADALGRARASYAARGIEGNFGSPLETIGDISQFGELDAQVIRTNAQRESLQYEAQASNFSGSARLKDQQASNARTAGFLSAGSSLIGGAGTVAKSWYNMK